MKWKFNLFVCFYLLMFYTSYGSDKVLTSLDIDNIDAGGVYSRANIGTYFDANIFYVFYPAFYSLQVGENIQRIKAHKMMLKPDGTIENHEQADLNDICFPAACTYFQSKIYLVGQPNQSSGSLVYKTFDGSNWSGAKSLPSGIVTKSAVALVELNNKLFLFYKYTDGSLRMVNSVDGVNWSAYKEVKTAWLDPNHGAIAACTFIDTDNKSKILYAFTNKENSAFFTEIMDENGNSSKGNKIDKSVNNISMIQGSTHGGNTGNQIQIIYSVYNDKYTVHKVEYSIANNTFSTEEVLDFGIGDQTIIGNQADYVPGTFYTFYSSDQDANQKYIITSISHFYKDPQDNYGRNIKFYSWKSDILRRDKSLMKAGDEMTDYNPAAALCKLVGVIEGPPPYTANGYAFRDWGPQGYFPPSSLEYGTKATSTTEKSTSIKTDLAVEASIHGIGGGFQNALEDVFSQSISKTIAQSIAIEPTEFVGYGYRVFLKPVIQRKKYFIFDWKNDYMNISFYTFQFFGPYIVYEPYKLSESGEGINPLDIYTYLDRKRSFSAYKQLLNLDFEWGIGSNEASTFSFNTTKENSNESGTKIGVGIDEEFGEIFKIKIDYAYEINYKVKSVSSFTTDFALKFYCPGNAKDTSHVKYFNGKMYWLLPTKNQNNWWVPKGFEKDSAWLMTYNLTSISNKLGEDVVDKVTEENMLNISPNPSSSHFEILLNLPEVKDASIVITDIFGNTIKEFQNLTLNGLSQKIIWNTEAINGTSVPSGVYLINLKTSAFSLTKKVTLIK
ncbi:MAG: T9SS type A sorting domain-containing protein [bacterium]